jgi:hypothetical protein
MSSSFLKTWYALCAQLIVLNKDGENDYFKTKDCLCADDKLTIHQLRLLVHENLYSIRKK